MKIAEWMASVIEYVQAFPAEWANIYESHQDFWQYFPELIWALNRRQ